MSSKSCNGFARATNLAPSGSGPLKAAHASNNALTLSQLGPGVKRARKYG
ncbi:hypothetical protein [Streptomyces zaomyceticus]